jgi:hypothetical protein
LTIGQVLAQRYQQQQRRQQQIAAAAAPRSGPATSAGAAAADARPGPASQQQGVAAELKAQSEVPEPASAAAEENEEGQEEGEDTQLIFKLERRGDGWAEEIFPHFVVEQRPLGGKKKRAYSRPDPWKVGGR